MRVRKHVQEIAMNTVRPMTKCMRCRVSYQNHAQGTELCPGVSGHHFLRRVQSAPTTSFSDHEIDWLDEVLRGLLCGAELKVLARAPELTSVMRKVQSMKARAAALSQGLR